MKIAFFNYLPLEYGGGLAQFYCDISVGIKKRYPVCEPSVVTVDQKLASKITNIYSIYFGDTREKRSYKQTINIQLLKDNKIPYKQACSWKELRSILQEYDIIYCKNDLMEVFLLQFFVGYHNLPPVIIGFHTPVYYERTPSIQMKLHNVLYHRFVYDYFLRKAVGFHVLNNFDALLLQKRFPDKKIYKIYTPFDAASFNETTAVSNKHNKNKISLLWIGRLTKEKGADDLLQLIDKINSTLYDTVSWTIVGDGDLSDKVLSITNQWQNIQYIAAVEHDKIANLYKAHDIFITTSKCECFPYVVLEAQATGLPVLAYDIHGINDIVINGRSGWLVHSISEMESKSIEIIKNQKFEADYIRNHIRHTFPYEKAFEELHMMFMNIQKSYDKSL